MSNIVPIPPLVLDYYNVPNIAPFAFREAPTYLSIQKEVSDWLSTKLVPWIITNVSGLNDNWKENTEALIQSWNLTTDTLMDKVDTAVDGVEEIKDQAVAAQEAAEAARDLAEQFASQAAGVQDSAITLIFQNTSSMLRGAMDLAYASKDEFNTVREVIETGRLSSFTLDEAFGQKANNADINPILSGLQDSITALNASVAAKADKAIQTIVEEGRLSEGVLNARFRDAESASLPIMLGGFRGDARFDPFVLAMIDPRNTLFRVCVLGSSSSNGAYTTHKDKAMFARLAKMHGSLEYEIGSLDTVSEPPTSTDTRWWSGAQGNTTSQNYFPQARRDALARVNPDVVFHMIGENDYFYGTTIAGYKANLESALSFIETANPDVINVMIFSHGRNDVPTPVAPWTAYGQALKEVVSTNPRNRYFIDAMEYFWPMHTMSNNDGGMLMDSVHPGDSGHARMAAIIGAHVGIPDPFDFYRPQTWEYPLGGGPQTITQLGTVVGGTGLSMFATRFPREIEIQGTLWINNSNASAYLNSVITNAFNGAPTQQVSHSCGPVGASSVEFSDSHYIPSNQRPGVLIQGGPSGGNIVVQHDAKTDGYAGLSRVKVTARPA